MKSAKLGLIEKSRRRFSLAGKGYNQDILFEGGNVAIFPNLGIVYNRIKKSGNTTVAAFLFELANTFGDDDLTNFKKKILTPQTIPFSELKGISSFYSFTVVRNPYSRALSAFLNKVSRSPKEKYKIYGGCEDQTPKGFNTFLLSLQDGYMYKNRHFWPQVELLYQPATKFNRIAKLENLVEDMKIVLSETGHDPAHANALDQPHRIEVGTRKVTSASTKLEQYYDTRTMAMVRELYHEDFKTFGYSTHFVS